MHLSAQQINIFEASAEASFLLELQRIVAEEDAAFLPRFHPKVRPRIVSNLAARARHVGATWQSSICIWSALMVTIAPNLHSDPAVRAWLASTGRTADQIIKHLAKRLSEADWDRVARHRRDLPLLVPPEADALPLPQRVGLALPLVLWDEVTPEKAGAIATSAIRAAQQLGLQGLEDAPVAVAAWRFLYGASIADSTLGWPADIRDPALEPATRLAMLRARIMMDHGRWA